MNDYERLQYEKERAIGEQHKRAWESTIKPFFDAKDLELYNAFKETNVTDDEALKLIRLQFAVLQSMQDHFEHYINSGQLASKLLNEGESNGN